MVPEQLRKTKKISSDGDDLALLAIHMNKGWSRNATGAIIAKLTYSTTALWRMAMLLWIHICTVWREDSSA